MIRINTTVVAKLAVSVITAAGMTLALGSVAQASDAETYYLRHNTDLKEGMRALKAGELETASTYLKKAAQSDLKKAHKSSVLNNLCAVDNALERFDSAKEACDSAIKVDRYNWRAWVNSGHVAKAMGEYDLAMKNYRRATRLGGDKHMISEAVASLKIATTPVFASAK